MSSYSVIRASVLSFANFGWAVYLSEQNHGVVDGIHGHVRADSNLSALTSADAAAIFIDRQGNRRTGNSWRLHLDGTGSAACWGEGWTVTQVVDQHHAAGGSA